MHKLIQKIHFYKYIKLNILPNNVRIKPINTVYLTSTRFYSSDWKNPSGENSQSGQSQPKQNRLKNNKNPLVNNEKSFLKLQNDPDKFGQMTVPAFYPIDKNVRTTTGTDAGNDEDDDDDDDHDDKDVDEGDLREEQYLENQTAKKSVKKLSTKQYADLIKAHFRNRRIAEAIAVLEQQMLVEDQVKPENYIYNLIISELGRIGWSKKAFQLYNQMKQRGLKVTGATYTALFNACALSPYHADSLKKMHRLREIMTETGYIPNETNYNVMIKAYGRCQHVKSAFTLVDEMRAHGYQLKLETFHFLLHACISDREYGFRHALLVWHKMLQFNLKPDYYTFNLLLNCCKDCHLGDSKTIHSILQMVLSRNEQYQNENNRLIIDGGVVVDVADGGGGGVDDKTSNTLEVVEENSIHANITANKSTNFDVPNLLSKKPYMGNLIEINDIKKAEHRLLLIGGTTGFINEMKLAKVVPDIKTFTALLEVAPSTKSIEKKIIQMIREYDIKVDIDFFNVLIKKRCMRFDYPGSKEVVYMIEKSKLLPDIVTYGVLALSCQTADEANDLLQQMDDKGIMMNIQILGAMLKNACYKQNVEYIIRILDIQRENGIRPNGMFLKHLFEFEKFCSNYISTNKNISPQYERDHKHIMGYLRKWRNSQNVKERNLDEAVKELNKNEQNDDPWRQWKEPKVETFEPEKNIKQRHEKKLKRFIRRINPNRLKDDKDEDIAEDDGKENVNKESSDNQQEQQKSMIRREDSMKSRKKKFENHLW